MAFDCNRHLPACSKTTSEEFYSRALECFSRILEIGGKVHLPLDVDTFTQVSLNLQHLSQWCKTLLVGMKEAIVDHMLLNSDDKGFSHLVENSKKRNVLSEYGIRSAASSTMNVNDIAVSFTPLLEQMRERKFDSDPRFIALLKKKPIVIGETVGLSSPQFFCRCFLIICE